MKATLKPSLLIGGLSFLAPFVGVLLACRYGFGWDWKATQIGVIEPEIKGAFAALLLLMWLGDKAHSHPPPTTAHPNTPLTIPRTALPVAASRLPALQRDGHRMRA